MGNKRLSTYLLIVIFVIGLVFLIGCSEEREDTGVQKGTIERAEISESEMRLLRAVGVNQIDLFDVEITSETGRFLQFWVDYYEDGEHKGKFADAWFHVHSENKEGQFVISRSQEKDEWLFSLIQEQEGSVSSYPEVFSNVDAGLANTIASIESKSISENGSNIIMVQAFSEMPHRGFSDKVFEEDEEAMNELFENRYVYIVRVAVTDSTQ